jgi:N-acetylmuramoyl-L-alanine amidase
MNMIATTMILTLTVVLDPGHGGSNSGAPGRAVGSYEKQVTLAVAKAVRTRLEAAGVKVVMTRDHDEYQTLRARGRVANQAQADCFVSLHANASPDHSRRGAETWVLSRDTADVEARRARSKSPGIGGLVEELRVVEAQRASFQLAHAIQPRLASLRGGSPDRGIRQATYDVLSSVTVPAVLVEVGFLDHAIEGPELLVAAQQERIAAAIADGILAFAEARNSPQKAPLLAKLGH